MPHTSWNQPIAVRRAPRAFRRPGSLDFLLSPFSLVHSNRAFALVSVLAILALLLVLMLSISTVLHVETRSSASSKNLLIARENALLGLDTALSQLQEYAGRDQAVTFPATTFYPTKDMNLPTAISPRQGKGDLFDNATYGYRTIAATSKARSYLNTVGTYLTPTERIAWDNALKAYWNANRNPRWTGIMDASLRVDRATNPNGPGTALAAQRYESNPATKFGEPKRDQLPVWLVSGNEKYSVDQAAGTIKDADGNDASASYLTPDQPLPDPATDPTVVYVVGEGSATLSANSTDGMDGRVKAKKQELKAADATVTGHYAYWVGDESTKANFSARDRTSTNDSQYPNDVAQSSVTYRNRLQVPQRIGWQNLTGFGSATFAANDSNLENINTSMEIGLLEDTNTAAIKTAAQSNFHSLTAFSKSLLTDTALGGLKKDLTRFLENGSGLSGTDTIPNPSLYDTNDARFNAWGHAGSTPSGYPTTGYANTGFPNTGANALDGIPTWSQLNDWYHAQASGSGSGSITPTATTAPVLTYIMLHKGMSYDPVSKKIRQHWLPCIVLWNPYDVGLNSATYNLDLGVSEYFLSMLFVKENPSLAELQQDADADWRDVTVPAGSGVNGPDGKPVLARDGVTPYTNTTSSTQTIRIFKGTHAAPGNTTITQYFKQIIPGTDAADGVTANATVSTADNFNMLTGPWPYDSNITDGTTDAFGRYYYYVQPANPALCQTSSRDTTGTTYGPLGAKAFSLRCFPFSQDAKLPVEHPLNFQITSAFGPGEALIFTVPNDVQWTPGNPVVLTNQFQPVAPASMWFDFLSVANGPASATAAGVKWHYGLHSPSQIAPTVNLSLSTDPSHPILSAPYGLGGAGYNTQINAEGHDWDAKQGDGKDDNANTIKNDQEPTPKFVSLWKPLYDEADFAAKTVPLNTDATTSSIYGFSATYWRPLLGIGTLEDKNIHTYFSVFSRFNIFARTIMDHPLVDKWRNNYGFQNFNESGNFDGMIKFQFISFMDMDISKWDDNQYNGDLGFALVEEKDYRTLGGDDANFMPLSVLSVRNARRANSEILSLGQFQQVNLSPYFWEPAFPIGSSDAAVYTDREAIAGINSRKVGANRPPVPRSWDYLTPPPDFRPNNAMRTDTFIYPSNLAVTPITSTAAGNTMLDMSYLLNENLWDRFFLSTIIGTPDLTQPLPNSRLRFTVDAAAAGSALTNFDTAAAYLENVGALNVNSTSVDAWKALLTAFRDLQLQSQLTGETNPAHTAPVSRSLSPIQGKVDFTPGTRVAAEYGNESGVGSKDYTRMLGGFRYLDDTMIQTLAERIVDEIRMRGPFLCLADFVNRRLVAPSGSGTIGSDWYQARTNGLVGAGDTGYDYSCDLANPSYDPFIGLQGINGALQRALNVSGINGGVNHPTLGSNGAAQGDADDRVFSVRIKNIGTADFQNYEMSGAGIGGNANTTLKHSQDPSLRSHVDTEHVAGVPVGEAGQLFDGAPGFVTQGDLLAMIGPALTPRGDTFLVRTYGDAVDMNGKVLARAYLEAIVQRVADPVTPAGATGTDKWRPTDKYGRRFKIVKLRWLNSDEV